MKKETEFVNKQTGEIISLGKLNQVDITVAPRKNGTIRIQQGFDNCPTMAEQHTAHLSDINYLMATYQPDELAAYIAARGAGKIPIEGHDFSKEPDMTHAKNIALNLKKSFEALDPELQSQFKNHVEFLKFIDNPANAEKMLKLGLMTKREVQQNQTQRDSNAIQNKTLQPNASLESSTKQNKTASE